MDIKRNNLDLNDIAYQDTEWDAPRECLRIMQGGEMIWEAMCGLTPTVKQTIYADYPTNPSLAATIWTALKAYARSHTALVSYINNDPDLYCSLPLDGVTGRLVRWLVSDGYEYINTGIYPISSTMLEMQLIINTTTSGSRYIFGVSSPNRYMLAIGSSDRKYIFDILSGRVVANVSAFDLLSHIHKIESGKYYVDGTLQGTLSNTFSAQTNNAYLFSVINKSVQDNTPMKIAYCKVDTDRYFIPYHNPTTNECGMIDIHDETNIQFYGNANSSGAFTVEKTAS